MPVTASGGPKVAGNASLTHWVQILRDRRRYYWLSAVEVKCHCRGCYGTQTLRVYDTVARDPDP